MIESMLARWLFTAVFAAAAVCTCTGTWAVLRRRRDRAAWAWRADRAAAVFCLVMCAALIAMTWLSEPAAATWVQVAGFGAAALWLGRASLAGAAPFSRPHLPDLHHVLMAGAMIWMLTALGGATPMRPAANGHEAMTARAMSAPALTVPVVVASGLVAAGCAAAAVPWLVRAFGPGLRVTDSAAAGQAVMSAGMAAMLIAML